MATPWFAGPRLVRTVLRHWAAERTTVRQGLSALTICVSVTLVAGVVLGAMEGLLAEHPGLLLLVPSTIGMRGAIFGALGARLGTGILTGQYDGDLSRGSFTRQNLDAGILLTLFTAGLSAVLAWGTATLVGLDVISLTALAMVSGIAAVLSTAVVLPATLALARTAESRRWDMDAIGTPIITAVGDVTSLPALVLAALLLINDLATLVAGILLLLVALGALVAGLMVPQPLMRRIVRESTPVLCYAAGMQVLAGTVLSTRLDTLIADPVWLVVIPPFLASSGALGGILSARLSSQLHVGLLEPRRLPHTRALLEGSLTTLLGVAGYLTVGALTHVVATATGFSSPGAGDVIGAALIGGIIAIGLMFAVAYYAATASYRFGLDPDNYGIPIVTASLDFLGIVCLVVGIAVVSA